MSVTALAARAGVSQPHLSRVLRRRDYKSVSGELAGRVARALDLPEDYFPEFRERVVMDEIGETRSYATSPHRRVRTGR